MKIFAKELQCPMIVAPHKNPRWRKLSKQKIDAIVENIAEGSTHKYSAQSNGVSYTILKEWLQQGELDLEYEEDEENRTLPAYLVASLAKIKQKEVISCRKDIRNSEKGHKGAEWTLEHAYWRDFGGSAPLQEMGEEVEDFKGNRNKDKDAPND